MIKDKLLQHYYITTLHLLDLDRQISPSVNNRLINDIWREIGSVIVYIARSISNEGKDEN